jgi:hypothetical protein
MKVLGADVARVIRSAAARGEVADLLSARKGCGKYQYRGVVSLECVYMTGVGLATAASQKPFAGK